MGGQSAEAVGLARECGTSCWRAKMSFSFSEVNSCSMRPDAVKTAKRSAEPMELRSLMAAWRPIIRSDSEMLRSSKKRPTKRWGSCTGAEAEVSPEAGGGAPGGGTSLCEEGVSTEKLEMSWGLPLSKRRKSSFVRFGMALPLESRTTTRTTTRLTLSLKEVVSWEVISLGGSCAKGGDERRKKIIGRRQRWGMGPRVYGTVIVTDGCGLRLHCNLLERYVLGQVPFGVKVRAYCAHA